MTNKNKLYLHYSFKVFTSICSQSQKHEIASGAGWPLHLALDLSLSATLALATDSFSFVNP